MEYSIEEVRRQIALCDKTLRKMPAHTENWFVWLSARAAWVKVWRQGYTLTLVK